MKNKFLEYGSHIRTIIDLAKINKNWYEVLLLYFDRTDRIDIVFRSGLILTNITRSSFGYPITIVEIGNASRRHKIYENNDEIILNDTIRLSKSCLHALPKYCTFYDNNGSISKKDGNFTGEFRYKNNNLTFILPSTSNGIHELVDVFINQCYNKFDFKNKIVLDIGGFIGDSAIFFACEGAKKIISFEPNPVLYNIASNNIKINALDNKIELNNYGVSDKCGELDLFISERAESSSIFISKLKQDPTTKSGTYKSQNVRVNSIKDIFDHIESVDILKVDCEGCEYPILEMILKEHLHEKISEGIILEAHPVSNIWTPNYAMQLLKKMNFNIRTIATPLVWFIWGSKK